MVEVHSPWVVSKQILQTVCGSGVNGFCELDVVVPALTGSGRLDLENPDASPREDGECVLNVLLFKFGVYVAILVDLQQVFFRKLLASS